MFDNCKLRRRLKKGEIFGFEKATDSAEYLGCIHLVKLKPNFSLIDIFSKEEKPNYIRRQQEVAEKPYRVIVDEFSIDAYKAYINKKTYSNPDIPAGTSDFERIEEKLGYSIFEIYWFRSLKDVGKFLIKYDKHLNDIKEISQVPHIHISPDFFADTSGKAGIRRIIYSKYLWKLFLKH